ncbi:Autophagy protein 16 [Ceratocystis fimbriata CBS 114723]|uniref:Autophagy protein 16 n=1 Tax=Ceratocystis fimbriata CBS 114723 TaxID=1035309 RepID=A0A2C5WCR6_9PEZI|nr:Autophagy protein 16 [Ceratocystis fimbriata CBS 114723]
MSRYLSTRSDWRQDYICALDEAEKRQPDDHGLLDACANLADRIAVLEAENALLSRTPTSTSRTHTKSSSSKAAFGDQTALELQRDLTESLRKNSNYEARLRTAETELEQLRAKTRSDLQSLTQLKSEHAQSTTKTHDLKDELQEKRRLLDHLQDEMITINLQLTVAEKERDSVKAENKQLIQRFLNYKAQHQEGPVDDALRSNETPLPERRKRAEHSTRSTRPQ